MNAGKTNGKTLYRNDEKFVTVTGSETFILIRLRFFDFLFCSDNVSNACVKFSQLFVVVVVVFLVSVFYVVYVALRRSEQIFPANKEK